MTGDIESAFRRRGPVKGKGTKVSLLKIPKTAPIRFFAGRIANYYDSALTLILGHIQVAKIMSNYSQGTLENLELAEAACFGAQDLTQRLLTFAEGQRPLPCGPRVLVIEANRLIAKTILQLLYQHGYRAEWARNGLDGLRRYKKSMEKDKYAVVLMTPNWHEGTGSQETVGLLRKLDPRAKVAISSQEQSDWRFHGFDASFPRPYKIEDLVQGLRELVAES